MSNKDKAIKRIRDESKQGKYDRYGNAVKASVLEALEDFIGQDEEFAQAIVEKNGSFEGCIAAVVKGCGSCISDIEVYRRAVGYYFPGATVSFKMEIDLIGSAAEGAKKKGKKKGKKANVQECEKDAGCEAVDKPEATASDGSVGGPNETGEVKKKISLSLEDFL